MTRQAVYAVIAGFFTISIAYTIRYGYGMLLPGMVTGLGISKTSAGTIYATYFLTYTLFSPLLGWLSDRYNICIILSLFTTILAVGAGMMALTTSVASGAFFFGICGIGHAACWAPVMALVQRSVPDEKRGTALAVTTMGSGIGIAVWSLILPMIVERFNWQGGWIGMGICGICVAGINALVIRDNNKSEESPGSDPCKKNGYNTEKNTPAALTSNKRARPSSAPTAKSISPLPMPTRNLFHSPALWFVGTAYLLVGFSVLVPYTFLNTYATETLGFSFSQSTRFFTVIAISGLLGKAVLGPLSDSLGRVHTLMICGGLLAVGTLGMGVYHTAIPILCFCFLFGFAFGAVWPLYAAAAPDFFPKNACGSVIGIWTVFMGIGSIVSPVICGWSIDVSGGYLSAFIIGGVCAMGSSLLLVPMIRTARKQLPLSVINNSDGKIR